MNLKSDNLSKDKSKVTIFHLNRWSLYRDTRYNYTMYVYIAHLIALDRVGINEIYFQASFIVIQRDQGWAVFE